MSAAQAIANDDWATFPAIAAAIDAMERATSRAEYSAAQDELRKAELQRAIALGLTDLWDDWEIEQAQALGLL